MKEIEPIKGQEPEGWRKHLVWMRLKMEQAGFGFKLLYRGYRFSGKQDCEVCGFPFNEGDIRWLYKEWSVLFISEKDPVVHCMRCVPMNKKLMADEEQLRQWWMEQNAGRLLDYDVAMRLVGEDDWMERDMIKDLRAARPDLTIIRVTHRLQTAAEADHIIALDRGRVVASGSWSEVAETRRALAGGGNPAQ